MPQNSEIIGEKILSRGEWGAKYKITKAKKPQPATIQNGSKTIGEEKMSSKVERQI